MREHDQVEQPVEAMYVAYAPGIIRYLTRLTGSYETAEDLVQDTFVKALRHKEHITTVKNAHSWLFRIARNTAYDNFRQCRNRATMRLADADEATLVAVPTQLSVEENELLSLALAQLPSYYRIPLLLQSYAGYSVRDIAQLLDWKEGTVKSRLKRGRTLFQKCYASL